METLYLVLSTLFLPISFERNEHNVNNEPASFWPLMYILSDERAKKEITEEVLTLFRMDVTQEEEVGRHLISPPSEGRHSPFCSSLLVDE